MAEKKQQRLRYTELAPDGIATLRALEHYCNAETGLSPVLLELVRLRASQRNGCDYCIGMHSHELTRHNEPESRIAAVAQWPHSDAFTETERAALAWTEAVTDIQQGHVPDAAYAAAREHFGEVELVNLTLAIVSINAWNRMAISFRAQHRSKPAAATGERQDPTQAVTDDDGGKVVEE